MTNFTKHFQAKSRSLFALPPPSGLIPHPSSLVPRTCFSRPFLFALLVSPLFAQNSDTPDPAAAAAATPAPVVATATPAAPVIKADDPAITFLRKVEEKNKDLKTLYGSFSQVRENVMFSEEIHSTGQFWHTRPNHFRCDYSEPSPAQFFLVDGTGYFYSPENKQLDKFKVDTGDKAPINELLVGFGLKVESILDIFTLNPLPDDPSKPGEYTIEFVSRDVDRTLNFQKITIAFDRNTLEPKRLVMEEATDDIVRIELKEIKKNVTIPDSTYKTEFPADVTIHEM